MHSNNAIVANALEYRRLIRTKQVSPEDLSPEALTVILALFDVAREKIIFAHNEQMVNAFDQEVRLCQDALSSHTYGMSRIDFLEIERASCALLRNE